MDIQANHWGRVAVLAGGHSPERAVSLESGRAVHAALCAQGINAQFVDLQANYVAQLQSLEADRAWIALHGGDGENGIVQAVCHALALPYTGSSTLGCAIAMDKCRSKDLFRAHGLLTADYVEINPNEDVHAQVASLSYPLAIKPVTGGSSLGNARVDEPSALQAAIDAAFLVDSRVMAECWIQGRELTVGILDQQALPVIEIKPAEGFYDFAAKYEKDSTAFICLQEPHEQIAKLQAMAKRAFDVLGCEHWGRVDFIEDTKGQLFLLECNTVPGMTSHSLVPQAAKHAGMSFKELVVRILASTLR